VVLVTGLVNDIREEFLLNYYTAQIFYNTLTDFSIFETAMKDRIGITNDETIKRMWFDDTYGFSKLSGFNSYMRMLILGKTRIRTYLTGYFGLEVEQMDKIVSWKPEDNSWLYSLK
jgi:hypothetical protein